MDIYHSATAVEVSTVFAFNYTTQCDHFSNYIGTWQYFQIALRVGLLVVSYLVIIPCV